MKKALIFLLSGLVLVNCSDNPDDNPQQIQGGTDTSFELESSKNEVFPFELVSFDIDNDISLLNSNYKGFLGESEITFIQNDIGGLSVVIPEVNPGSYNLKLTINGKEGATKISVLPLEEIENIDNFLITNFISEVDKNIIQAKSLLEGSSNPDLYNESIIYLNEFTAEFEKLGAKEKMEMAYFLKVNEIDFQSLSSRNFSTSRKDFDFDSQIQPLINGLLVSKSALVVAISGIAIATIGGQPLIGIALVGIAYVHYANVLKFRLSILDAITIPISNELSELTNKSFQSKIGNLTFKNGISKNFTVISKGRKLIRSDVNNSNQKIAQTVSSLNESDTAITDLRQKVQTAINIVGSFFSGRENKIEDTEKLPEQAAEEIISVALDKFFIQDLPTDISVDIVTLDENTLQIKFTSQKNEGTQFMAKFIYDDGDFKTETALNVSIEKIDEVNIFGRWEIIQNEEPSGSTIFYAPATGEVVTVNPPPSRFVEEITFQIGGGLRVVGSPRVDYEESASFGQYNSTIELEATYERPQLRIVYTFSLTWDANQDAYIGTGTGTYKEWYDNDKTILTIDGNSIFSRLTMKRP